MTLIRERRGQDADGSTIPPWIAAVLVVQASGLLVLGAYLLITPGTLRLTGHGC